MEHVRALLNKDLQKTDQKLKETVGDLYFYSELEHYLSEYDRKRKTDQLTKKVEGLRMAKEEIEFLINLMDQAGIDGIFAKHRRDEERLLKKA